MNTLSIQDLAARNDVLFTVNHSGGKDSQAQLIRVLQLVPADRVVVIHADLGRIEWAGTRELAQEQAAAAGCDFEIAQAVWADGSIKDFVGLVRDAKAKRPNVPSFPSSTCRNCTSDLKRTAIEKVIRRVMKDRGFKLVVNCIGIRGAESTDRAQLSPFVYENENLNGKGQPKSKLVAAGRQVWTWLPIFDLQTLDVWCVIRGAGQQPHWAYAAGNERVSCVFCVMGSAPSAKNGWQGDIVNGAKHRPELFAELSALEAEVGYTLHMSRKTLAQLVREAELQAAA